jgi:hypothetical protein
MGPGTVPWTLHIACASGFFLLSFVADVFVVLSVYRSTHSYVGITSLRLKMVCIAGLTALITANIVTTVMKGDSHTRHQGTAAGGGAGHNTTALHAASHKDGTQFPGGALIEWLCALCQLGFNSTFYFDLVNTDRKRGGRANVLYSSFSQRD